MKTLFILLVLMTSLNAYSAQKQLSPREDVMTHEEIKQTVSNTINALEHTYLYPERATQLRALLSAKLNNNGFRPNQTVDDFRRVLRSIIIKATKDTSIDIVREYPITLTSVTSSKKVNTYQHNDSIEAEILEHNIGYLKLAGNINFNGVYQAIEKAFESLSGADAMIIDLRLADETHMQIAQLIVSYFVPNNTIIGQVEYSGSTSPLLSLMQEQSAKQALPLYILNSSFVAGEWEFISYTLKHFNKAMIVGEETMGVGHFTKQINLNKHLTLKLPYAVIKHPVTQQVWDENGVVPDHFTKADKAFDKAYEIALRMLNTIDNK